MKNIYFKVKNHKFGQKYISNKKFVDYFNNPMDDSILKLLENKNEPLDTNKDANTEDNNGETITNDNQNSMSINDNLNSNNEYDMSDDNKLILYYENEIKDLFDNISSKGLISNNDNNNNNDKFISNENKIKNLFNNKIPNSNQDNYTGNNNLTFIEETIEHLFEKSASSANDNVSNNNTNLKSIKKTNINNTYEYKLMLFTKSIISIMILTFLLSMFSLLIVKLLFF